MKTFQITPVVAVQGNQGASVRTLSWNRTADNTPRHLLVSHSRQDEACRATETRSPRRFTAWQADANARPDLRNTVSLAGQTLLRDSSDSGRRYTLFDTAGRPVWTRDARGTVIRQAFDHAGRPVSVTEHPASGTPRLATRYEYDDSASARQFNLRGATVRGYDDGGLHTLSSVSLSGAPLTQSQRFLADPEARPDRSSPETLLEDEVFVTSTTAGASGAVLTFTDADGSARHTRYDVSGVPCRQTLTVVGGSPQTLLAQVTYSAAGQVTQQRAGNGVTTTCTFEPQTQRLLTLRAVRDNDATVLQDLSWSYDPVGNILSVTDATVATCHYRNQTTGGTRTFTYDAHYQLHTATGRESAASTTAPYAELPALMPADSSQFVPYSRTYAWDDSGNLQYFSHLGAASFTRAMVTATDSDRSLLQNSDSTLTPADVSGAFDPCGNLLRLQISASASNNMVWDAGNHLQCVITLNRSDDLARSDREIYQYSAGLRVRKQTRTLTRSDSNLWTVDEVRYLPGLEIRRTWQESGTTRTLNEERHDITTQAGRANIRLLHWLTGKPAGMPDSQLRYSLSDIIGSLSLELDAEGLIISREEYYPFGGTAVWSARSETEAGYKVARYAGKERDSTGLYDYGYRYYAPWLCRWTAADPAGEVDGLNLYRMVGNNPVTFTDYAGLVIKKLKTYASAFDMTTPYERKLNQDLPEIVRLAEQQITSAIEALQPDRCGKVNRESLQLVQDLMGDASQQNITNIIGRFQAVKKGIQQISLEDGEITLETAHVVDKHTPTALAGAGHQQQGTDGNIYISSTTTQGENIHRLASAIIHETSHIVLKTMDNQYGKIYQNPGEPEKSLNIKPLLKLAARDSASANNNAESVATLASLLHYKDSDELKAVYDRYVDTRDATSLEDDDPVVLEYGILSKPDARYENRTDYDTEAGASSCTYEEEASSASGFSSFGFGDGDDAMMF
jgi:insecticidal toxin complex protein TccC